MTDSTSKRPPADSSEDDSVQDLFDQMREPSVTDEDLLDDGFIEGCFGPTLEEAEEILMEENRQVDD